VKKSQKCFHHRVDLRRSSLNGNVDLTTANVALHKVTLVSKPWGAQEVSFRSMSGFERKSLTVRCVNRTVTI